MTSKRVKHQDRDVSQQLSASEAREQLTYVLEQGGFNIPSRGHVRERMENRDISVAQIVAIAEKGKISRAGEWENGSWRYQVWRGDIGIVVMFITTDKSRVCTVLELEVRTRRRQRKSSLKRKKK